MELKITLDALDILKVNLTTTFYFIKQSFEFTVALLQLIPLIATSL